MKRQKIIALLLITTLILMPFSHSTVNAATKQKTNTQTKVITFKSKDGKKTTIKYTLKKHTLTISGKGVMPYRQPFPRNKKIEKVVIKKGITFVYFGQFYKYRNLKKITIPKTVKEINGGFYKNKKLTKLMIPSSVEIIMQNALSDLPKLNKLTIPGNFIMKFGGFSSSGMMHATNKIKTIKLNTNLDLGNVVWLKTENIEVLNSDPNYQSIDGVIYSKDGKDIVRVPLNRKELTIFEGCENFNLCSIFYGLEGTEGIGGSTYCKKLKRIVIPASIKCITDDKYVGNIHYYLRERTIKKHFDYVSREDTFNKTNVTEIVVKSKQIPQEDLELLKTKFNNAKIIFE